MKGLTIFGKTNVPTSWTLAAWHSPHSVTWRWSLTLALFRADEWRVWPIFGKHRCQGLLCWWARIPFVGFLHFNQQHPMWYRDLYVRLRNREDQRNGMLWLPDGHPDKIHRPKEPPAPMILSPGSPTIN